MKSKANFASRLGAKPVALISLIASCLVAFIAFSWQYQNVTSEQNQQYEVMQQKVANIIYTATASHIAALSSHIAAISKSPQLVTVLEEGDARLISEQQQQLIHQFPSASNVCLFPASVDALDESACIPITFATLNSLRQAKKEGSAPIAVMQLGSKDAHVLLAQRITSNNDEVVGVLVVVFKPDFINKLLLSEYGETGYIELQQGIKRKAVVLKVGNERLKKMGPVLLQKDFPNSYWRLMYWPAKGESLPFPLIIIGCMIAVLVLLWLIREMWQSYLLKQDAKTLGMQLSDFRKEKLKSKYDLAFGQLQDIVDDIQTMGRDNFQAQPKPKGKSTAESIDQMLAETGKSDVALNVDKRPLDVDASLEADTELTSNVEVEPSLAVETPPKVETTPTIEEAPLEMDVPLTLDTEPVIEETVVEKRAEPPLDGGTPLVLEIEPEPAIEEAPLELDAEAPLEMDTPLELDSEPKPPLDLDKEDR